MLRNIAWNNTIQRFLFLCIIICGLTSNMDVLKSLLCQISRSRGQRLNYQWVAKINKCANGIVLWCDLPTNKRNLLWFSPSIPPSCPLITDQKQSSTARDIVYAATKRCLHVLSSVEPKLCLVLDLCSLCLRWSLQRINSSQAGDMWN